MADAGPAKVPPTFKALVPFIRRAEELDRDSSRPESKLIAYFCRQYAMELGIKLREHDASNEATDFLLGLMDRLEAEKDKLPEFSQEEGKEICEDFAMEIFSKADDEDRAGLADKNTAKTFYAAGTFFDILNQFGDISDDVAEKRKYCKYKAATILKALKEGQVPTPGPPDGGMGDFKGATGEPPSPVYSAPPVPPAAPSAPPSAPEPSPAVEFPSFTGSVGSVNGPSQYSAPSFQGQPQQQYQPPPQAPSAPVAPPTPMPPIPPPVATPQTIPSRSHGSPVSQNEVDDAIECAKFAIAALKIKDIDLAVQRLEMALRSIK